jgi:hypothetical protein
MATNDDDLARLRQETTRWRCEVLEGEAKELLGEIESAKQLAREYMRGNDMDAHAIRMSK